MDETVTAQAETPAINERPVFRWRVCYAFEQVPSDLDDAPAVTLQAVFIVRASDAQEAIRKTQNGMERAFTEYARSEALLLTEVKFLP